MVYGFRREDLRDGEEAHARQVEPGRRGDSMSRRRLWPLGYGGYSGSEFRRMDHVPGDRAVHDRRGSRQGGREHRVHRDLDP